MASIKSRGGVFHISVNWKMNGSLPLCEGYTSLLAKCARISGFTEKINFVVHPSFVYIDRVGTSINSLINSGVVCINSRFDSVGGVYVGAQNCSVYECGAYTGEVGIRMLSEIGVKYVILNHTERRGNFAESDSDVVKKIALCQKYYIIPILCVGESYEEYQEEFADEVIQKQMGHYMRNDAIDLSKVIIAYEPTWTIGTKNNFDNRMRLYVEKRIETILSLSPKSQILYGGSVDDTNIANILQTNKLGGILVGGASINLDMMYSIINQCILCTY